MRNGRGMAASSWPFVSLVRTGPDRPRFIGTIKHSLDHQRVQVHFQIHISVGVGGVGDVWIVERETVGLLPLIRNAVSRGVHRRFTGGIGRPAAHFPFVIDDLARAVAHIRNDSRIHRVAFGSSRPGAPEDQIKGLCGGLRLHLRGGEWHRALQGSLGKDAFPIVPADFGPAYHEVAIDIDGRGESHFGVEDEVALNAGGTSTQVVVDVIQSPQVATTTVTAPVVEDVVAEIALDGDVTPTRDAAFHVREKIVMPGAAVAAHATREGMPLPVVAFPNDAPLHRKAIERPAGGQGMGIAPTARAMVNNEIVAVGSAEALGSELASVISRAEAQKADDDVMRFRQFEGNAVALVFLDADAVTGRRLACDGQVRLAGYQPLRFNQTANP